MRGGEGKNIKYLAFPLFVETTLFWYQREIYTIIQLAVYVCVGTHVFIAKKTFCQLINASP